MPARTFVTGYNLNAFGDRIYELGEGLTGPTITHMRALAKELGVYIIAPIAMQMRTTRPLENNAVVIDDEGEVIGTYSKTISSATSRNTSPPTVNTRCLTPNTARSA